MPLLQRVQPAFLQVADHLRKRITSSEFKTGDKLPSTATIAKEWGIDSQTAHRAVRLLVDEGLVRTEWRKGSYVRDRSVWKINQDNP